MNFPKLFFLAVLIVAAGFVVLALTRPEVPVRKTITNAEGKTLEALIVGKEGGRLTVERIGDQMRFELEVETLSQKDRMFAMWLAEAPAPPEEKKPEEVPKEDNYVAVRRKAVQDLRERERVIKAEIASQTLNDLLHQNRIEQLARVEKEIRELELAIETYEFRMKR